MQFEEIEIECNANQGEYTLSGEIPALDLAFRLTVDVIDYDFHESEDADLYSPGHGEYTEITRSTDTMEVWRLSTWDRMLPVFNDKIERELIRQDYDERFYRAIESELTNWNTSELEY